MSSYSSMLSASLQEILSEILDMGDQLHTASIEYTVMRESGQQIGFEINIQCLLAEQKEDSLRKELEKMPD